MTKEIEDQAKWDSYFIPGTSTLKNNLGIIEKKS